MKRNLLVAFGIVLILFAFASCTNDGSNPGSGNAQSVVEKLDSAGLIGDAVNKPADEVVVDYTLVSQEQGAILRLIVEFKYYPTETGTITSGILFYDIPGMVSDSSFSASGSTCTVYTDKDLVIKPTDGDSVSFKIEDKNAAVADVSASMSDGEVISAQATVTASADVVVTVVE